MLMVDAEKRRHAVRSRTRQVFRSGIEHEVVHHPRGLANCGRSTASTDAGDAWHDLSEGVLVGDLAPGGAWRGIYRTERFPYELKEEFDGAGESDPWSLADALLQRESRGI